MFTDPGMLIEYFEMGGFVMLPLALVSIALWYGLAYRYLNVRASKQGPRELIKRAQNSSITPQTATAKAAALAIGYLRIAKSRSQLSSQLNESFRQFKSETNRYRALVRALVAIAPLLGLLGTVDGMIETFDSLGEMELFSQSGGIAGGISRALFTTQMGLAISIPGLLAGRLIDLRQQNISRELDQISDLVCAKLNNS